MVDRPIDKDFSFHIVLWTHIEKTNWISFVVHTYVAKLQSNPHH